MIMLSLQRYYVIWLAVKFHLWSFVIYVERACQTKRKEFSNFHIQETRVSNNGLTKRNQFDEILRNFPNILHFLFPDFFFRVNYQYWYLRWADGTIGTALKILVARSISNLGSLLSKIGCEHDSKSPHNEAKKASSNRSKISNFKQLKWFFGIFSILCWKFHTRWVYDFYRCRPSNGSTRTEFPSIRLKYFGQTAEQFSAFRAISRVRSSEI